MSTFQNAEMRFNFGDTPMKHLPSGYTPLAKTKTLVPFQGTCNTTNNTVTNYFLSRSFNDPFSSSLLAQPTPKLTDGKKKQVPMALILEPARELAQQTHENIKLFKKHLPTPKLKYVQNKQSYFRESLINLQNDFWSKI